MNKVITETFNMIIQGVNQIAADIDLRMADDIAISGAV